MVKAKNCYNCKTSDGLIYIKSFSNYYMVKCEKCMVLDEESNFWVHPIEGGNSMDEAIESWNKRI